MMAFVTATTILFMTLSLSVSGATFSSPTGSQETYSNGIETPKANAWIDVSTGLLVGAKEVSMFGTYSWSSNSTEMISEYSENVSLVSVSNPIVLSAMSHELRLGGNGNWVIAETPILHAGLK